MGTVPWIRPEKNTEKWSEAKANGIDRMVHLYVDDVCGGGEFLTCHESRNSVLR